MSLREQEPADTRRLVQPAILGVLEEVCVPVQDDPRRP